MLSRLALPLVSKSVFRIPVRSPQFVRSAAATTSVEKTKSAVPAESQERDLVNFPRPVQAVFGGKVRLGFLPDEWFKFFYRKTGVTGPYLFGAGLITFLCSKEWYIMEHEFMMGIGLTIFWVGIIKKFGPKFEVIVDKWQAEEINEVQGVIDGMKENYKKMIKVEETEQWRTDAQNVLFDAKRENVALQLEAEYRKRLYHTYQEVKKRLDYHVQYINTTRQVQHKHMVNWIIDNVIRSISPQQEEEALKKCISDLKVLATR